MTVAIKKTLRSYKFEFNGVSSGFGAVVVVIAYTKSDAQKAAVQWAISKNLKPDTICYSGYTKISETPTIVYQWDGDY